MSKVRVYEVARDLGMSVRDLVALFQSLGVSEVRNHMSAVGQDAVERVKRKLERKGGEASNIVEEQVRPGVVKRRSRATPSARTIVATPSERSARSAPSAGSRPGMNDRGANDRPSYDRAPTSGRVRKAEPEPSAPQSRGAAPSARGEAAPEPSAPSKGRRSASAPSSVAAPSRRSEAEGASVDAPPTLPAADLAADASEPLALDIEHEPVFAEPAPLPTGAPGTPGSAGGGQPVSASVEPASRFTTEPATPSPAPPDTRRPPNDSPRRPPNDSPPVSKPPALRSDGAPQGDDAERPRRPTSPPKTGIEVWDGWNPQHRRTTATPGSGPPSQRRKTYDPRANVAAQQRHGGGGYRPGGPHMRPGFRPRPGGFGSRNQRRGPTEVSTKEMSDRKKVVKIEGETSLQALAAKMSMKATDVLMKLLGMGMTGVNINTTLDIDTAKLLAGEFGWSVEDVAMNVEEELAAATEMAQEDTGDAMHRAPVVTVMGHVDHGKTTLLDTIRKAQVAAGEAGGITQHIGAYRVETKRGTICFLDTPGHEAFTSMRARGASVTDLVILVVAADDGVMPQTREAIAHARDAEVPIIVAVNKIDKHGVDTDRLMREMANEGLSSEDWGGDTIFCRVSALTGEGVDHLLEMVLLQSEMLELRAHPQKRATGVVVEALLDRGRGAVARVLVQDGTLMRGDVLLCGAAYGRIRAMVDEKGRQLKEAGPSTPVEVLGLNEVPDAGDPVHAVKDIKVAETLAAERRTKKVKGRGRENAAIRLDELATKLAEAEQLELKVIIKGDVQGSVEALQQALEKLSTKRVKLTVVHTGVGGISESDVNLAAAGAAIIIGFSVRPAGKARKHAEQEGVEIRLYNIIYECIDEVRGAMEGLLPARRVEKELGKAEVRTTFRISKVGTIAGCMVIQGSIKRSAEIRLIRDSVVVWTGKLSSLKRFKDDAREVKDGMECGIGLDGFNDLKDADIIEAYDVEEVKATLD